MGFNIYFLWVFGDSVEDEVGKTKVLLLIALGLIFGNLVMLGFPDLLDTPLIGTGPGIAALLAFYLLRFPHKKVMYDFFGNRKIFSVWILGAAFFVKDIFIIAFGHSGSKYISIIPYFVGALVGVVFYIYTKDRFKKRFINIK